MVKHFSSRPYCPDRGDLVWLNFDPQAGREQAGHHPALVISSKIYNAKSLLALFCPITSRVKNYPYEVHLSEHKLNGVILCDHIKNLDWTTREIKFIGKISPDTFAHAIGKIRTLIG